MGGFPSITRGLVNRNRKTHVTVSRYKDSDFRSLQFAADKVRDNLDNIEIEPEISNNALLSGTVSMDGGYFKENVVLPPKVSLGGAGKAPNDNIIFGQSVEADGSSIAVMSDAGCSVINLTIVPDPDNAFAMAAGLKLNQDSSPALSDNRQFARLVIFDNFTGRLLDNCVLIDSNGATSGIVAIVFFDGFFIAGGSAGRNAIKLDINNQLQVTFSLSGILHVGGDGNFAINNLGTATQSQITLIDNTVLGNRNASSLGTIKELVSPPIIQTPAGQAAQKVAKMTTTQRDALTPVAGDIIYNTTTNKHQGYNGTIWNDLF